MEGARPGSDDAEQSQHDGDDDDDTDDVEDITHRNLSRPGIGSRLRNEDPRRFVPIRTAKGSTLADVQKAFRAKRNPARRVADGAEGTGREGDRYSSPGFLGDEV